MVFFTNQRKCDSFVFMKKFMQIFKRIYSAKSIADYEYFDWFRHYFILSQELIRCIV